MAVWDPQSVALVIRLFGQFDVQIHDKPMPRLRTRKGRWLLALLILRQGGPVDRPWLAGLLWPESTESQALANLRLSLTDLRHALGDQAPRLTSTPLQLAFDLTGASIDVRLFDRGVVSTEASRMEEAVALYRGPLLEGCTEEWVLLEREAREQVYLQTLERLAALALSLNDWGRAVAYLRRAALVDPLCESVQRKLMEALAASGDLAAAQQVYRDLRLHLHRELNAEPDAETIALSARLRQAAREQAVRPRSLPRIAPTAPPLRLPRPLSALIGREGPVEEILLRLASSRLVTLTGAGGVGKTRLAIEAAEQSAPYTPDGVFFVDFAPLVDGGLAAQAAAQALELKEAPGRSLMDLLQAHLHDKRLLLLLDNCEHLLQDISTLTAALLQSCPHLRILATSRQALGITGEVSYRAPSLPSPPACLSKEEEKDRSSVLLAYASVRLFVERARAAASDFELTEHNLTGIAQICRRLDGMPLALEMAAARVKALSVGQIAERLEASFALLSGGSRTALPRQQTLRATLDWSWSLLSISEQALLRRLSVFAGGWTLEAAERIAGSGEAGRGKSKDLELDSFLFPLPSVDVLDLLTSLVDKSLVIAEERDGAARYRLLETVRQYARDRLVESEESDLVRGRHRDCFLALSEEAKPKLTGGDQAQWLERLETEHDNLRSALEWSLSDAAGSGAALQLCGALSRFWATRGHLSEGREWCIRALGRGGDEERTQERAKVLNGAGGLARMQGDNGSARAYHAESLTLFREIGDRSGIAALLNNLGLVAFDQGDYAAARAYHEESLTIAREIGDPWGVASSLINLGVVVYEQGDFAFAKVYYEESLTFFREKGDQSSIALSLMNLGNMASAQGENGSARAYYEESLTLFREIGDRSGIAKMLNCLGMAAEAQCDYASAWGYQEESLAIEKEIGDRGGIARTLNYLGSVAFNQGEYASARAYHEEGLTLFRESGDRRGIAHSLAAFARLAAKESKPERAAALWGAAKALYEEIGAALLPKDQDQYNRNVANAREALGREVFSTAWAKGRAMTLEEAMDFAMEMLGTGSS